MSVGKWARTFSATSSSRALECDFLSVTPISERKSKMALLLTSSSRASSLIRIDSIFFPNSLHSQVRPPPPGCGLSSIVAALAKAGSASRRRLRPTRSPTRQEACRHPPHLPPEQPQTPEPPRQPPQQPQPALPASARSRPEPPLRVPPQQSRRALPLPARLPPAPALRALPQQPRPALPVSARSRPESPLRPPLQQSRRAVPLPARLPPGPPLRAPPPPEPSPP